MNNHNMYVGPFVLAETNMISKDRQVKTCSNVDCEGYKKANLGSFCPLCGSPILSRNIPIEVSGVCAFTIEEAIDERMRSVLRKESLNYWISNLVGIRDAIGRDPDISQSETIEMIPPGTITREIEAFSQYHAADIKILKDAYEQVKVCWGTLGYWS